MDGSCGGGPSCSAAAQEQISYFFGEQVPLPFSSSLSHPGRGERGIRFPDAEQLDCDVEEDGAKPAAPSRSGSGSKRTRAAEVHNLSEKMLSMRNGLNLHDMYLSSMVHSPLQASEICMGFNGESRIAMNGGQGMLAQNQQASSHQIQNIVTSLTAPREAFQLPMTAEMLADDIVLQQQLEVRSPNDGMKTMLHFGGGGGGEGGCSLSEDHSQFQRGVMGRNSDRQFNILRSDGSLHPARSLPGSDIKAESLGF